MLEPTYGEGVDADLDLIELDPSRRSLWNAIVDAVDLVCDEPDSASARRYAITAKDRTIWRVPIHAPQEAENYSLLWAPDGNEAIILYVGIWPPARSI